MKKGQKLWTKNEILIAINLYHKIPFGQFHSKNETIIKISKEIGRSPSSLSLKLANLASLDESLDRKGMSNHSKLDQQVWNEFYKNIEEKAYKSEILISKLEGKVGFQNKLTERESIVKQRVNQSFFRKTILSSYDNKCCISGLNQTEFLIASHIKPWKDDKENRLNPRNGFCLNILYDKAFDKGFITIDSKFKVVLSNQIKTFENTFIQSNFKKIENLKIRLPKKFAPDREFIDYHNNHIFIN